MKHNTILKQQYEQNNELAKKIKLLSETYRLLSFRWGKTAPTTPRRGKTKRRLRPKSDYYTFYKAYLP